MTDVLLTYGSYRHEENENVVTFARRPRRGPRGDIYAEVVTATIQGVLHGATQQELTAKCTALEAAYVLNPYQELVWYDNAGQVAKRLSNNGSTTGVRCVAGPDYPVGEGAEYTTYRHYTIVLEAEYPFAPLAGFDRGEFDPGAFGDPGREDAYTIEFRESVTFSGGGPLRLVTPVINGPPVEEILYSRTPYRAVQSGSATAYNRYPRLPPLLWPAALARSPVVIPTGPTRIGRGVQQYGLSWTYEFESPEPLIGSPHALVG